MPIHQTNAEWTPHSRILCTVLYAAGPRPAHKRVHRACSPHRYGFSKMGGSEPILPTRSRVMARCGTEAGGHHVHTLTSVNRMRHLVVLGALAFAASCTREGKPEPPREAA